MGWLVDLWCLLLGHGETLLEVRPQHLRLRCMRCQRVSPGWRVL